MLPGLYEMVGWLAGCMNEWRSEWLTVYLPPSAWQTWIICIGLITYARLHHHNHITTRTRWMTNPSFDHCHHFYQPPPSSRTRICIVLNITTIDKWEYNDSRQNMYAVYMAYQIYSLNNYLFIYILRVYKH